MVLKPQDLLVLLKLVVIGEKSWSYSKLAVELGMSPAEVHAAARRLQAAQLGDKRDGRLVPNIRNLSEFLATGVRYVFVPEWGELTRGVPTLYAAPPLSDVIVAPGEPAPVWPDTEGEVRGVSFSPLYKSVPKAALADPELYELLVLVDAIRSGRARERETATRLLMERLGGESTRERGVRNPEDDLVIGNDLVVSRAELGGLVRRYHIKYLGLFGSAARGELHPGSDIDLLVEFEPGNAPSLWSATELQDAFSRLFGGRSVDIVPPEVLRNPYRRKTIERDMKVLFDEAA
jgi:predicted nucleotidyltransferase